MSEAIADASTLINLAAIGRLDLLRVFHGAVLVPPVVWREVVTEGGGRPGADESRAARGRVSYPLLGKIGSLACGSSLCTLKTIQTICTK
jgi:hypothetical protein